MEIKHLTKRFLDALTTGMSCPAAAHAASMIEFTLESFYATDREGWREGVIDGLCRQLTRLAVPDIAERYWRYRGPFDRLEEITAAANERFGIREQVRDVFLADGDCIDLGRLEEALKDYWLTIYEWLRDEWGDTLDYWSYYNEDRPDVEQAEDEYPI